jgi:hypothetical protein
MSAEIVKASPSASQTSKADRGVTEGAAADGASIRLRKNSAGRGRVNDVGLSASHVEPFRRSHQQRQDGVQYQ